LAIIQVIRYFISGIDCAMAADAMTAVATLTPAVFKV
jgi:hypothetical protein